jgi:hypothetical protein
MITPQQIVAIGLRLVSILLVICGFRYLVPILVGIDNGHWDVQAGASAVTGVLMIAVAVVLWLFPMMIAHAIIPRTRFENRINLNSLEAARVGCCLIGLWQVVESVPYLLWLVLGAIALGGSQSFFQSFNYDSRLTIVYHLARIVFGIVLVIKADWFALLAFRSRKLGNDAD